MSQDTIPKMIVGAYREAWNETGFARVVLLIIITVMLVPFFPVWALMIVVERAGFYSMENGYQIPNWLKD